MTPSGTPAETKPMNSGTAEHEQNGVSTPRPAAMTWPTPAPLPESRARVFSALKKLRTTPMAKTIADEQHQHLGHVVEEEGERIAGVALARHRQQRGQPFGERGKALIDQPPEDGGDEPAPPIHGQVRRRAVPRQLAAVDRRHAALRSGAALASRAASSSAAMAGVRSGLRR